MKKSELLEYEMPTITEFISNKFLQDIIARYLVSKVNRKWKRLLKRKEREKYLRSKKLI